MKSAEFDDRARYGMLDRGQVRDMDELGAVEQRPGHRVLGAAEPLPQPLRQLLRVAPHRDCSTEIVAVVDPQSAVVCAAKAVRLLQYRVEHRGEIAGRGID